jgi:hypothetical protein
VRTFENAISADKIRQHFPTGKFQFSRKPDVEEKSEKESREESRLLNRARETSFSEVAETRITSAAR